MFRKSKLLFCLNGKFTKQYTKKKFLNHNLCLVTDSTHVKTSGQSLENIVKNAIDGGCTMVQYREKNLDYSSQKSQALKLQQICKEKKIPFLINDNVQLAKEIKADGVHVGQDDMQASQARNLLGEEAILGITVHNISEVKKAISDGADYLGTGAIFKSVTKSAIPLGIEILKEIVYNSSIPIIAIGGIDEHNANKILEAGASGLAVASSIILAKDPMGKSMKFSKIVCDFQKEKLKQNICLSLKKIREKKPLILQITNNVVMNISANITLAIGASPLMATDKREMQDLMNISDALLINIGTIREEFLDSILLAGHCANAQNKPIILDPVGVGASKFRYEIICNLIDKLKISIIKGNCSEIGILHSHDLSKQQKGVDADRSIGNAEKLVAELAEKKEIVVAMTGFHDFLSDGKSIIVLKNNCDYLPKITGSGCIAGSLIAAFASVERDYLAAACGGIAALTCAAELVEKKNEVKGPASFQIALFDQVHNLDEFNLKKQLHLDKVL